MSVILILECDRIGCDAAEQVPADDFYRAADDAFAAASILPDGWAVDRNGFDHVLHCPLHADETRAS